MGWGGVGWGRVAWGGVGWGGVGWGGVGWRGVGWGGVGWVGVGWGGGIERAGRLTNLHSDLTKTVLVGTEMRDGRIHFLRDTVYLNGHPVQCATGQDYVRVLGRHALPHLFHSVASRRLFSGTRSACRALRAPKLPAHYPLAMFVAKCHGTVNWFTSVRPPSYGAMRVLDAMAASALRATAGWALSASAHFLRDIPEGGVGVPPAPVVGFANFLGVYIRHLNHPNPLVRRSTRHGLLTALWRFHPSQLCLTSELGLRCAAHSTDHDLFVALCHQCDISIHLPPTEHLPDHAPHVMALSSPGLEVQDTHAWMITGHRSAEDAHRGGWPRVSSRPTPPVGTAPPVGRCHAVTMAIPAFSRLPENYGILHDASWCPRTRRCGGAVAVFCPVTLRYQVYPVTIPLRLDNAYTAELYTAWVALTARGPSADPTFGFRSSSWHFADCKGYITAQEGQREPDDSLQGDLIRECRAMASGHTPPRHLYSHITGTWLDALLDQVDAAAGRAAVNCPATVGWLSPLQDPRVCFSHAGLQVHDALPHARRALLASHHAYAKTPPPQRHPALGEYATAVGHGLLTWGDHLTVTGIRLSLFPPKNTPCPLCLLPAPGGHVLSCPLDPTATMNPQRPAHRDSNPRPMTWETSVFPISYYLMCSVPAFRPTVAWTRAWLIQEGVGGVLAVLLYARLCKAKGIWQTPSLPISHEPAASQVERWVCAYYVATRNPANPFHGPTATHKWSSLARVTMRW